MNGSSTYEPSSEIDRQSFRNRSSDLPRVTVLPQMHQLMVVSLFHNVRDALFPEKLPPLKLTSRAVNVRQIWSQDKRTTAASGSLTIHALGVACLVALSILGIR